MRAGRAATLIDDCLCSDLGLTMKHDDNLTAKLPNFVTHLECAMTGERSEADQVHNLSRAGKPLLVRYDLAGVRKALTKETLAANCCRFAKLKTSSAWAK